MRAAWGALLAVAVTAASMAWLWGYTVDDALITCRVATQLARGLGYRFNAVGPTVDAVTPLGFAHLLAPFAAAGPLSALSAAKWLGALTWLFAAAGLGLRVVGLAGALRGGSLVLLLGCAPLAAWAVSGMETGLVTGLAVLALGPGALADASAALAAALRPELAPWCASVRLGLRLAAGASLGRATVPVALVLAAVALVGVARTLLFGRAAPLSLFAKPSDLAHGASYALHAFVQTGLPLLCVAPLALFRSAAVARAIALAAALHFLTLVLVGGDWMSLYRLAVPILPSLVLAAAHLSSVSSRSAWWLRFALAAGMCSYLAASIGPGARGVGPHRAELIRLAQAPLAGARSIAALDVGWVGAASDARILDLAGVTDETVAMLRGGHTSKRIDPGLFERREVDAIVLLSAPGSQAGYAREVEQRVAGFPSFANFREVARLPLGGTTQFYSIRRRP